MHNVKNRIEQNQAWPSLKAFGTYPYFIISHKDEFIFLHGRYTPV